MVKINNFIFPSIPFTETYTKLSLNNFRDESLIPTSFQFLYESHMTYNCTLFLFSSFGVLSCIQVFIPYNETEHWFTTSKTDIILCNSTFWNVFHQHSSFQQMTKLELNQNWEFIPPIDKRCLWIYNTPPSLPPSDQHMNKNYQIIGICITHQLNNNTTSYLHLL